MKKMRILVNIVFFNLIFVSTISASFTTRYIGEYQNEHFKLDVTYICYDPMYHRQPFKIIFFITAKPGFKLINQSSISLKGKVYQFNRIEFINQFFEKGKIDIKEPLLTTNEFKLTYHIYNVSNKIQQRITKNFKITLIHSNNRSEIYNLKMIIKEEQ